MLRTIQLTLVIAVIMTLTPVVAFGDLIAYDGFNYTADATVVGNNGGDGWVTAWTAGTTNASTNALVSSTQVVEGLSTGNSLYHTGHTSSSNSTCNIYRAFDSTLDGTVYASFLVVGNGDHRSFGFSLASYDSNTQEFSYSSNQSGNLSGDGDGSGYYGIAARDGDNALLTDASDVATTATKLFVLKFDMPNGTMDLYLLDPDGNYPASESSLTADASLTGLGDMGETNALRFFAAYSNAAAYTDSYYDDVRIGTTWSDVVVSVPEPSTLALLACGLVGLLAYAWRKRK